MPVLLLTHSEFGSLTTVLWMVFSRGVALSVACSSGFAFRTRQRASRALAL